MQRISGLPCGLNSREPAYNAGDMGLTPRSGRSLGEWNGNPLQYPCLKDSTDRGAWWAYTPWGHKESDMTEWLTHTHRCRESFWQYSTPTYDKNSSESRHRRNMLQYSKGHIQQTHSKHYSQWWKTESISSKTRSKTRMFTLTTIIQHSFGSPSHSNQRIKRNKKQPDWKRSKTLTVCRRHDSLHRKPIKCHQQIISTS